MEMNILNIFSVMDMNNLNIWNIIVPAKKCENNDILHKNIPRDLELET